MGEQTPMRIGHFNRHSIHNVLVTSISVPYIIHIDKSRPSVYMLPMQGKRSASLSAALLAAMLT